MKRRIGEFSFLGSATITLLLAVPLTASAQLSFNTTVRGDGKTLVTFTGGSGTWTVPAGVGLIEVLVVGGGGSGAAGGTWNADGGGAGGLTHYTAYSVTADSSVSITVGAGGAALAAYGNGNNGSASAFGSLTAAGGEGGLGTRGGNSGGVNLNGTITSGGQGATHAGSNGGGGAGQNGSGNFGDSPGGNGLQVSITGASTYYAGGGGGGFGGGNNAGGLGGGGKGATDGAPDGRGHSGTDGLGGGGGASRDFGISGGGGSGVIIVAYELLTAPPAPAGLVATSGVAQVALTWAAAERASGYKIWSSNSVTHAEANDTSASPSFTKSGLTPGVLYHFKVSATNAAGQSDYCAAVATIPVPATPTDLAATRGIAEAALTWTAASGATGYKVWSSNSVTHAVATDALATTSFLKSGLSGDLYYFKVAATNDGGDSPYSAAVTATPFALRNDGYLVIPFTSGSTTWTVPDGVSSIEVLVAGGGGGSGPAGGLSGSGGGAGGVYSTSSLTVTPGSTLSVTVGTGGGTSSAGGNSVFGVITAFGGESGVNSTRGGNSGGYSINGGATTGVYLGGINGWGGGGAGAGQNGAGGIAGIGGNGITASITGSLTYYGGGGGNCWVGAPGGGNFNNGGLGGGGQGDGHNDGGTQATNGQNGYGGGGGAPRADGTPTSGGSGIVIVAYKIPNRGTVISIR